MKEIEEKGVPSDACEPCRGGPGEESEAAPRGGEAVREEACAVEENPRDEGEVVEGDKIRRGKAEVRREEIRIPRAGQARDREEGREAEDTFIDAADEDKEKQAPREARRGRRAAEQGRERRKEQHGRAEKGEDAEEDGRARHEAQRGRGDGRAAEEDFRAAPERPAAERPGEAREEDKGPADALLPQIECGRVREKPRPAAEMEQVPREVEARHAEERRAAERIEKRVSVSRHGDLLSVVFSAL